MIDPNNCEVYLGRFPPGRREVQAECPNLRAILTNTSVMQLSSASRARAARVLRVGHRTLGESETWRNHGETMAKPRETSPAQPMSRSRASVRRMRCNSKGIHGLLEGLRRRSAGGHWSEQVVTRTTSTVYAWPGGHGPVLSRCVAPGRPMPAAQTRSLVASSRMPARKGTVAGCGRATCARCPVSTLTCSCSCTLGEGTAGQLT